MYSDTKSMSKDDTVNGATEERSPSPSPGSLKERNSEAVESDVKAIGAGTGGGGAQVHRRGHCNHSNKQLGLNNRTAFTVRDMFARTFPFLASPQTHAYASKGSGVMTSLGRGASYISKPFSPEDLPKVREEKDTWQPKASHITAWGELYGMTARLQRQSP
ncbi:hypothetical protein SKAU_G00046440 [Synaphobranchus kaupii]|uniref:Uncharacterized protein n=1 Tax=Synaphobranchus kaupii TaxID=118154 RepID=A0A9Q1G364_SYNKA|nr:hypothetical protein SKAU_G00046440 [Synaphobranchus kaupii]